MAMLNEGCPVCWSKHKAYLEATGGEWVGLIMTGLRTGSSTIRKCKCVGIVRKIKGQNVDIECLYAEPSYFKEVSEEHRVTDSEIICILGAATTHWMPLPEPPKEG